MTDRRITKCLVLKVNSLKVESIKWIKWMEPFSKNSVKVKKNMCVSCYIGLAEQGRSVGYLFFFIYFLFFILVYI